jgi:hypothetical protein
MINPPFVAMGGRSVQRSAHFRRPLPGHNLGGDPEEKLNSGSPNRKF